MMDSCLTCSGACHWSILNRSGISVHSASRSGEESITNDVIKEQNKYNVYAHLSMCSGDLLVLVQTDALLTEVLPSGSAHLENVVVLLQQQDR